MTAGIHWMGVGALKAAYAAGRVSVVAAIRHHLDRIAAHDGTICAFTHVAAGEALAAAEDSARRFEARDARLLEGVPVAIKANIDVAGWPVTAGVGAMEKRVPERDAEVVRRLRAAGAILIGMVNMHEAALGATTDNRFYGTTHNPHRIGHIAGGSSGGSGAAVAAGMAAAALGTDTLGSIRIPAAMCGVAGLKPTQGVVSNEGLITLVDRLDCIGPLARSVEDCALILDAIAALPGGEAPEIAQVATLSSVGEVSQEPAVRHAITLAARLLEGMGVRVAEREARIDHQRVRLAGFVEAAQAANAWFGADADRHPEGYSDRFRGYLSFGRGITAEVAAAGRADMETAASTLRAILALDQAILLPTTPQAAFAHGGPVPVSQADFTALANIAGLPALALPAGWSVDGLPVSVQLMGRPGQERALLALGARLEAALNAWRPPAAFP